MRCDDEVLIRIHTFDVSFAHSCTHMHTRTQSLLLFLKYFSEFNWDRSALTINGPIDLSLLSEFEDKSSRRFAMEDDSDCIFDRAFLLQSKAQYGSLKSDDSPFHLRHMNIVDPLRGYNNLGRSVSLNNYMRIRRAFAKGYRDLEETCIRNGRPCSTILTHFFRHAWNRNKKRGVELTEMGHVAHHMLNDSVSMSSVSSTFSEIQNAILSTDLDAYRSKLRRAKSLLNVNKKQQQQQQQPGQQQHRGQSRFTTAPQHPSHHHMVQDDRKRRSRSFHQDQSQHHHHGGTGTYHALNSRLQRQPSQTNSYSRNHHEMGNVEDQRVNGFSGMDVESRKHSPVPEFNDDDHMMHRAAAAAQTTAGGDQYMVHDAMSISSTMSTGSSNSGSRKGGKARRKGGSDYAAPPPAHDDSPGINGVGGGSTGKKKKRKKGSSGGQQSSGRGQQRRRNQQQQQQQQQYAPPPEPVKISLFQMIESQLAKPEKQNKQRKRKQDNAASAKRAQSNG